MFPLLTFALLASADVPSPQQMAASLTDVWAEVAIRQPGGPSYEFFKDLLPPLRYVNTAFHHYPIVLCAPAAPVKARYVSNGSALNARADKKPMWREVGTPVAFRVGAKDEPYGADLDRLDGPRYAEGYLPIVRSSYSSERTVYEQEAFAPVSEPLASCGAVLVRFTARGAAGVVAAQVDALADAKGQAILLHDEAWTWDPKRQELRATLAPGASGILAVMTRPLAPPLPRITQASYEEARRQCERCWKELLARGTHFAIPEPIVQDAWRALVIGIFLIASGDRMNYSAGNAYDHLYEAECGDAVRALMLYGFTREARDMVGPLLDFNRQATRYHVAGHKLQLLTHFHTVTRDAEYLRQKESVWRPVVDFVVSSRKTDNGLLPKDNYAGDIGQQVWSLNSNANCWRGLRDMVPLLEDLGEGDRARELAAEARRFRTAILDAVAKSEFRETKPPFLPMALFGAEKPHEVLTATRLGSYYDLMAPYVLGSGVLGPGSERETWLIDYLRSHGGLAMGMIRSMPHQGEFDKQPGVNVLYGLRYIQTLLRRDERDQALAGFYGQLAQGMTRETFIGGEGSRFFHGDRRGRSFYLPPNSASNAMFLTTLRTLIIQDWDFDEDGRPETLRLLYGAPGRWFHDGAVLEVRRAPTAFGEVSLRCRARLSQGEVLVEIEVPPRMPRSLLLRLPLPPGWRVVTARLRDKELPLGKEGIVDLSGQAAPVTLRFAVRPDSP